MIDINNIFKRIRSDSEAERLVAANKLYDYCVNNGGHPDDWVIRKKGAKDSRSNGGLNDATSSLWEAQCKAAQLDRDLAEMLRKNAEERRDEAKQEAKTQREARDRADAELAKLREELKKARAKKAPDRTERVDLLSGLLSQEAVDKLDADQIAERMATLCSERDLRQHNATAQVDLVIGQLTEALYQRYAQLFGKRKRGSNAPTVSMFLENYAGKTASWCRRCYKAYLIVTTGDWDTGAWGGTGGIEGINKSVADPDKPKVKRVNKTQEKLDALAGVVRRKQWEHAERMVNDWDENG